ncbi:hypothetical protein [Fibrobacter sp. UWH6]|uniref:hypothetical protein n=2 Tax=Fibrobacter TaxID=832 RepID=UPI00093511BD|nr:hypothetical protein [Fibrobacter sp. UWH6]OWV00908.1 hypothetical protein B7993_15940 [Fibrobacter sp. UWH3]
MSNNYIIAMKSFILCLFISVFCFATTDSLLVPEPLPDSVVQAIKSEQRIEQLNALIAKMKSVSECNRIQKANAKEKEYCRTRFMILHPELEEE